MKSLSVNKENGSMSDPSPTLTERFRPLQQSVAVQQKTVGLDSSGGIFTELLTVWKIYILI